MRESRTAGEKGNPPPPPPAKKVKFVIYWILKFDNFDE